MKPLQGFGQLYRIHLLLTCIAYSEYLPTPKPPIAYHFPVDKSTGYQTCAATQLGLLVFHQFTTFVADILVATELPSFHPYRDEFLTPNFQSSQLPNLLTPNSQLPNLSKRNFFILHDHCSQNECIFAV